MKSVRIDLTCGTSADNATWDREVVIDEMTAPGPAGLESYSRVRVWGYPGAYLSAPLVDFTVQSATVQSVLDAFGLPPNGATTVNVVVRARGQKELAP